MPAVVGQIMTEWPFNEDLQAMLLVWKHLLLYYPLQFLSQSAMCRHNVLPHTDNG